MRDRWGVRRAPKSRQSGATVTTSNQPAVYLRVLSPRICAPLCRRSRWSFFLSFFLSRTAWPPGSCSTKVPSHDDSPLPTSNFNPYFIERSCLRICRRCGILPFQYAWLVQRNIYITNSLLFYRFTFVILYVFYNSNIVRLFLTNLSTLKSFNSLNVQFESREKVEENKLYSISIFLNIVLFKVDSYMCNNLKYGWRTCYYNTFFKKYILSI